VNGGTVYISGWGGADTSSATNRTLPGQWQRISVTLNCTLTSVTFYLISFGGTNNVDLSSWQVTMPQAEPGSLTTPFVAGTRSTTQVLNDLTNNNIITASSLTYASNNSFSFNGTTDYINCGNGVTLQQPSCITMEAWVNPTTWAWVGNIMSKNGNAAYRFRVETTGALWWYVSGNLISGGTVPLNIWTHCVVTGDAYGLKAYINGVLVASNAVAFAPTAPTVGDLLVGSFGGAEFFAGNIDNTKIYNRSLSEYEIEQNFNAMRRRYGL
jgi:hypothetical protein